MSSTSLANIYNQSTLMLNILQRTPVCVLLNTLMSVFEMFEISYPNQNVVIMFSSPLVHVNIVYKK